MILTKQKVYWLLFRNKHKKTLLIISLKQVLLQSFSGQKSIVGFRTSELVLASRDEFPYSSIWPFESKKVGIF